MAQDPGVLLTAGRRDGSRTVPQCYDSFGQAKCEAGKSSYGCVPQYPGDYSAWQVAAMCHKTCGACNHTFMYRAEEADVLNKLHKATSGAAWTHSDGWGTNVTACWWYGVACDADGFVTAL